MKKIIVTLACATFMLGSFAQNAPSVQEVTKQVINSATNYAKAISCNTSKIDSKDIAALVPYKTFDDRENAKYAVLWSGAIGCSGGGLGGGAASTNLAIVRIGAGDSYVVDPFESSPAIKFEPPIRSAGLVGNTKDSLIFEGMEHASEDPNCCPSIKVRSTLRVDKKGDWKLVEKKAMPAKK